MEQLATRDSTSCQCSHERPPTLCNISYHCQKNHLSLPILGHVNPIHCSHRSLTIQFRYFCANYSKPFQERHKEAMLCHKALHSEGHKLSVCTVPLTVYVQTTGGTQLRPHTRSFPIEIPLCAYCERLCAGCTTVLNAAVCVYRQWTVSTGL